MKAIAEDWLSGILLYEWIMRKKGREFPSFQMTIHFHHCVFLKVLMVWAFLLVWMPLWHQRYNAQKYLDAYSSLSITPHCISTAEGTLRFSCDAHLLLLWQWKRFFWRPKHWLVRGPYCTARSYCSFFPCQSESYFWVTKGARKQTKLWTNDLLYGS